MSSQFPHFIEEHLVHASQLHLSHKQRSTLALLQNLHFYEVHNKQVLHFIDLKNTILSRIQNKLTRIVPEQNGTQNQSDILGTSVAYPSYSTGDIVVGKYIYQNRGDRNVYILLKCWNSMVVISKQFEGLSVQAEYDQVSSFKMCKGNNYQLKLSISFHLGQKDEVTNFQKNEVGSSLPTLDAYRKTLEKIKMKQSELLVHRSITKKEFAKLKSTELFGCNFLRTSQLEEMQILSKCGNAWVKVTSNDDVVIGVPMVNNCSSRLTILKNLRAVVHGCSDLEYKYTLYQLSKRIDDIENINGFFESQANNVDLNNHMWGECTNFSVRPEAFCVLILKLRMDQLPHFDTVQLPLFVFYDIVMLESAFSQKCFLTTLTFRDIYTDVSNRLNFDEDHLHRDLLTVISTSYEAAVLLEYNEHGTKFEDYLCSNMHFFKISRQHRFSEKMQVDEENQFHPEKVFFYNKNPDSLWHGTLLAITHNTQTGCNVRLFTKTAEKSKVFFRLLNIELRMTLGIKKIRRDMWDSTAKVMNLEAVLRDECSSYLEMCLFQSTKAEKLDLIKRKAIHKELYLKELKTDIVWRELQS